MQKALWDTAHMRIRRIGCICAYALHVIGSRASPPRRAAIFNFLQRFELRYIAELAGLILSNESESVLFLVLILELGY